MVSIFNIFGSILGYLLWFLYSIFHNYGVAIIIFTIIMKVALFPATVKQQRSMAAQAKISEKQKELQKRYANNRDKYNEELTKLYEKEGVNPSSGCLTTLLPFPIMLGIYYAVVMPLSNSLHIASDTISQATAYIAKMPGMVSTGNTLQQELVILRNWGALRGSLTMFSQADVARIDEFSKGFNFLGLDLLGTPQGSPFSSMLWVIPLLSLLSYVGMQVYTTLYQRKQGQQQQLGCTVAMLVFFPLMSAYWAFIFPAAVGFYWVISSITSWIQLVITNHFFSVNQMTAMQEARRAVTLEAAEAAVRPLPAETQKQIADRLLSGPQAPQKQSGEKGRKSGGKAPKKKGGDPSEYMGKKK